MRIVVDAMGSDQHPVPDVAGAVMAAREFGAHDRLILVGDRTRILHELSKHDATDLPIDIVHASQHVEMSDNPTQTARQKPDSSMLVGMKLVRDGQADAIVTAGNTGAALTLATLHTLQRIRGVRRPVLTSLIRVENNQLVVMADLGANPDAQPEWMFQFGVMGSLYAQHVLGQTRPRVALLSNGEEEGKGNQVVRQSAALFASSTLNFIGNVEPKEVLQGAADVVVTDGFVGNIMLKTLEAVGAAFFRVMRRELLRNPLRILGGFLISPVLRKIHKQIDPFEIGGAPLLGVNGVVIVSHGRSNAKGIKNAIGQARRAVEGNLIEAIRHGLTQYINTDNGLSPALKPHRPHLARRRHKRVNA
jgi:glycerol-3-phosphate acyltransferase PlsX